jgi:hypothetical protein
MTAFFCVRHASAEKRRCLEKRLASSFEKQGLRCVRRHEWRDGMVALLDRVDSATESVPWIDMPNGFVAVVGTAVAERGSLDAALRNAWDQFDEPEGSRSNGLFGNFQLLISKRDAIWLVGDPLGLIRIYASRDGAVLSSSWLAAAEALDRRSMDRTASQEYVLLGANHGDRTPIAELGLCDPCRADELTTMTSRTMTGPDDWIAEPAFDLHSKAVDTFADVLAERARAIARAFPSRVSAALSGGFDSRLVVAAMRMADEFPALFVYGSAGDDDVRVARLAADAIGATIRHVDKARLDISSAPLTSDALDGAVEFFDGIPTDGVFDRGSDRATRVDQSAGGRVAINGGGGEIVRNFFYLSDRSFSTAELVDTFWSPFIPDAFPTRQELERHRDLMIQSVESQTGGRGRLTRRQIELAYPLVRARYWTSRNNSLAVRSGAFLTLLLDPELVRMAASLPLGWKDYGRFECALIARLSPALARAPTSYGFTPAAGPSPSYQAKMWLQHRRPPAIRRNSTTLKVWMGRLRPATVPQDVSRLLPGHWAVDDVIRIGKLMEADQIARAATLEALIRRLGIDT